MFYLYEERVIQDQLQCWIDLGDALRWQLYMCWVATSLFVIPAFIISACYVIIIKTIWSKGSMLGPVGGKHRFRNGSAELARRRASSRGIIPKAKVKTVKMTIVIVIVFVLCWSPYIVFDLLQVFEQIPKTQTNIAIATFIQSLAPLNSAANPLIYCLFSTHFKTSTISVAIPVRTVWDSSGRRCVPQWQWADEQQSVTEPSQQRFDEDSYYIADHIDPQAGHYHTNFEAPGVRVSHGGKIFLVQSLL
ncbi:hypothetical protein RP20_CCG018793 [Aedes albopictus]|nr:hypothetical protein RP20_CCG018793 [Aedes albopictus]